MVHLGGSVLSNSVGCAGAQSTSSCMATMYQHGNFQGWQAQFSDGDYPLAQFLARGAIDNDGSSIVVTGGSDCVATVYGAPLHNTCAQLLPSTARVHRCIRCFETSMAPSI